MKKTENHNQIKDIQKYFLIGVLLISLFLLFSFIKEFFGTLLVAATTVTAIYPVHKFLSKKIKIKPTFSALLSLFLLVVIILIPLTMFLASVVNQASDAYYSVSVKINNLIDADFDQFALLESVNHWLFNTFGVTEISMDDIFATISDFIGSVSSFLIKNAGNVLKQFSFFLLHIIIFLLALFYFIRDGDKIIKYTRSLIPLSDNYKNELFSKMYQLMHSIVFGLFGAAVVQGFLVGLGLSLVGVHNAAFWGAVAAIMSPIPYIGTAVIWVPVVLSLFIEGRIGAGLFLLPWCMVIVGFSDNVIKPYIIGSAATLHPFAVMLVILGGTFAFGFKGLIFGPFILAITLAFLHIYQLEYSDVLIKKKAIKKVRKLNKTKK